MFRRYLTLALLFSLLTDTLGTPRAVAAPQAETLAPNSEYPDVPRAHWAYESVIWATRASVFEGDPDGRFHGDRPLTRYEFAVALRRFSSCGIGPDLPNRPFKYPSMDDLEKARLFPPARSTGVPLGHWAYDAVHLVQRFGVMQGNLQNQFLGDKPMTRYEFAVALQRILVLSGAMKTRR